MSHAPAEAADDLDVPLYGASPKIYPQAVNGSFRRIKWAILVATLGIYYLLPFLRWDRGPNEPAQAVLIDLVRRRFYVFFIEIWPQEVYYITGLLILAAMGLFLMNAVAGRVWCGYLCPQTVWTDLFLLVERKIQGDRRARMLKDAAPWTGRRIIEKGMTHAIWLVIAWWTGGAWVLYFADAPTMVRDLATLQAPFAAYASIGVLTFTTYALAGHMREQVCTYMCPWPRIQAALTDENALAVSYRYDRGEPRLSLKQAEALRAEGNSAGDCIDCSQCVAACPTGVDIRNGASLGCIQCGLCIDACDAVMAKIGRPTRLIAYDTDVNIRRRIAGRRPVFRIIRMRTLLYLGVIGLVGGTMLFALATRSDLGVTVLHDRNPMFVTTADGRIRNGFTMRIANRSSAARHFSVAVEAADAPQLDAIGVSRGANGAIGLAVGPDETQDLRLLVIRPPGSKAEDLAFRLIDSASGAFAVTHDHFMAP